MLRQQARDMAIANGAPPERVDHIIAMHRAATDALLSGASAEERLAAILALVEAQVNAAPADKVAMLGDRDAYVGQTAKAAAVQMNTPWMKFFISFDPATVLTNVRVPVYAAFGQLDVQVPPSLHEPPLRDALQQNPNVRVKVYEGANHLFQKAKTGGVLEYASLEKAFVPDLPHDLVRWILGLKR